MLIGMCVGLYVPQNLWRNLLLGQIAMELDLHVQHQVLMCVRYISHSWVHKIEER